MHLQTLIPIALNAGLFLFVFAIGLKASEHDATYLFRRPGRVIRALLISERASSSGRLL